MHHGLLYSCTLQCSACGYSPDAFTSLSNSGHAVKHFWVRSIFFGQAAARRQALQSSKSGQRVFSRQYLMVNTALHRAMRPACGGAREDRGADRKPSCPGRKYARVRPPSGPRIKLQSAPHRRDRISTGQPAAQASPNSGCCRIEPSRSRAPPRKPPGPSPATRPNPDIFP